jgi:murein L,D-transpeptidase YafK
VKTALSLALTLGLLALIHPAAALVVELDDVAPDRIERQRAFNRGTLPASSPDTETLRERLAEKGLTEGAPVLIRIFKLESELELWMRKGDTFVLQGTYPICHWTGSLGPKLREGDKQSPEGFYAIGPRQMRHLGRWRQAFNLGFPNLHDKTLQRTGSYILVHGGCSSTGCFAMTEAVQQEIYRLASAALRKGQDQFQVHVFPFRMTDENMALHAASPWAEFWRDLKAGYDAFEQTRMPPDIAVCGQRYVVAPEKPGEFNDGPLRRVAALKAAAAGFDAAKCEIPSSTEQIASSGVAGTDAAAPTSDVATAENDGGARVFRVERREIAAEPEASAPLRRTPSRSRQNVASDKREELREKRRVYRKALVDSYQRTMVNNKSGLGGP